MKRIDGIITDKLDNRYPIGFETYYTLEINYSSDIGATVSGIDAFASNLQGQVKLCLKEVPEFNEVFDFFFSLKFPLFRKRKQLDICLSLFYKPYYTEFYMRLKKEMQSLPKMHLRYIKSNFLQALASKIYYNIAYETSFIESDIRKDYILEKDICAKSTELYALILKRTSLF